ncbi:intercellular adhesion molecule 4 isoform X1 [Dendrobates tinctorius]|uniref:intercellular adhesion molecule 4 isoform X1 n=1 Tax=Dendrobates tinctorius TaxID=92724 RepID=UPI003CCA5ACE
MAPYLLRCIVLQLFLLSNAQHYLSVHPVDPVVSTGESIQLNCSINCPFGTVAWKGLDIFVDKQYIAPGYSVQTLENISISMDGTKHCEGTCPGHRKAYQKSLQLHVYALPNTLLLSSDMKNGIHYLNCSMELVYPPPEISCYKGSKLLEEGTDNEILDGDLYNVTWSWVVPEEDWLSDTSYRCEAQVHVNGQVFTREGTLYISKDQTTTVVPASTPSQITYILSQKLEAYYRTTTIISQYPESRQRMRKSSTIKSHQSSITGENTRNVTIDTIMTQSTQLTTKGPTKSNYIDKTTTAVPVFSTSQITSTQIQTSEEPYVTTTITTYQNLEATTSKKMRTTRKNHQLTIPGAQTKNATIHTVLEHSTQLTTTSSPTKSKNIDGFYLMWSIVPATGLVGSFLLFLQIYRHLSKKGFFQPNHIEIPTINKDSKSQGGLQAVFSSSTKNEFSMY